MTPRPRVLIARPRTQSPSRLPSAQFAIEEVSQMADLVQVMVNRPPQVLLLSIDFAGLGGAAGIREIRQLSPTTRVIVLTRAFTEREELEVLRMGARGYSGSRDGDLLFKMIDKVNEGEVWAGRKTIGALLDELYGSPWAGVGPRKSECLLDNLTTREREILRLLAEGASNKEIASALNVSVSTIKAHLTKVFRKLGQPDRLRLALFAAKSRPALFEDSIDNERDV